MSDDMTTPSSPGRPAEHRPGQPATSPAPAAQPADEAKRHQRETPRNGGNKPSAVALLPERLRVEVHARLRRGDKQADIRAWLATEGYVISSASMGRYARKRKEADADIGDALDYAAATADPDVDLRDATAALAATAALKAANAAARAEINGDTEAAEAALSRAERLARVLRNLEGGSAAGQERRDDKARRGDESSGEAGMSDESLRRARVMAGLAPQDGDEFDPVAEYGLDGDE